MRSKNRKSPLLQHKLLPIAMRLSSLVVVVLISNLPRTVVCFCTTRSSSFKTKPFVATKNQFLASSSVSTLTILDHKKKNNKDASMIETSSRLSNAPLSIMKMTTDDEIEIESSSTILTNAKDPPSLLTPTKTSKRTISKVEKFARLPVWPVWNGVFLFFVGKVFGEEFAAKLEEEWGGRVCPNFFNSGPDGLIPQTSPFIMLVHHRHSFAPWDPLRYIQQTFFPEGFPAHPHRGFITVTYILKGGFIHRDSIGTKQLYGAQKRHNGKHTQWLTTGKGILHEEMWDTSVPDEDGKLPAFLQPCSQELYQLWLNVPSQYKLVDPKVELLGGEEGEGGNETPTVFEGDGHVKTIVIAGEHGGKRGGVSTFSDVAILHVNMKKEKNASTTTTWTHSLPDSHRTAVIYMRKGSITIDNTRIPPHHTAYLNQYGTELVASLSTESEHEEADFLLLAGEPINEPVAAQGSMVMNTQAEIDRAYSDYQAMQMGVPWDHKFSDEEWDEHLKRFPSVYRPRD